MFGRLGSKSLNGSTAKNAASRTVLARGCWFLAFVVCVACGGDDGAPTPPVTADFEVAGTVEGLREEARVALTLNGFDALATGNGAFAFPDRIPEGTRYRVAANAPEGHVCSVQNAEGTVAADVRDVHVTCATTDATTRDATYTFGVALAADGDTLVVGAVDESSNATGVNGNQNDTSAPVAGAAYVFVRANGGVWTRKPTSKPPTRAGAAFGNAVSIHGDRIVVGSLRETSNARGINGSQTDSGGNDSGAAYVFDRVDGTFRQRAPPRRPTPKRNRRSGMAVAVTDRFIAASAPLEKSAATGVNGDANDTSAVGAGAVYVF